jgi:hypothetical protein
MDSTVTQATYDYINALTTFYKGYVLPVGNDSLQLFQSFTFGEMTIATLVLTFLIIYVLKWIWEVLR